MKYQNGSHLHQKWFQLLYPIVFLSLLSGCRSGLIRVSGTITLDGEPVENADILLIPTDPHIAPTAGKVQDGEFVFETTAGVKKVEVRASVLVKRESGARVYREYIPPWYNSQTQLTMEVVRKQDNRFTFALETAPPKPSSGNP